MKVKCRTAKKREKKEGKKETRYKRKIYCYSPCLVKEKNENAKGLQRKWTAEERRIKKKGWKS